MLGAFTLLLAYQLVGEIITQVFHLHIPGPVIGMLLLFITLIFREGPSPELRETSRQLLQYLSTLEREWLPILLGVLVGTPLVIAITAWLLQKLIGNRQNEETES